MNSAARAGLVIAAALLIAAVVLFGSATLANSSSANRIESGTATTYGECADNPGCYDGYLALPDGRGHRVKICSSHSGLRRCITGTSNDTGPTKPGRIADLDVPAFEYLCKCQWRLVGEIKVTVEYLTSAASAPAGPRPTLPPTDTAG